MSIELERNDTNHTAVFEVGVQTNQYKMPRRLHRADRPQVRQAQRAILDKSYTKGVGDIVVICLWLLTAFTLVMTLFAAFAIPSWPVVVLFILSLSATLLWRYKLPPIVTKLAFAAGLVVIAYDVYRLVTVLL